MKLQLPACPFIHVQSSSILPVSSSRIGVFHWFMSQWSIREHFSPLERPLGYSTAYNPKRRSFDASCSPGDRLCSLPDKPKSMYFACSIIDYSSISWISCICSKICGRKFPLPVDNSGILLMSIVWEEGGV